VLPEQHLQPHLSKVLPYLLAGRMIQQTLTFKAQILWTCFSSDASVVSSSMAPVDLLNHASPVLPDSFAHLRLKFLLFLVPPAATVHYSLVLLFHVLLEVTTPLLGPALPRPVSLASKAPTTPVGFQHLAARSAALAPSILSPAQTHRWLA
jgi:hypothetical protein